MAVKKRPGQPTSYRPEYCEKLVEYMREGNSFEAFGAVADVSKQTLYNWAEVHPEFLDAKTRGTSHSREFWENVAKMQATGQLRRIKLETPVLDANGNVVFDNDGKPVMRREYETASGAQATLIFMLKNMHGFRDSLNLNHGGQEGAPPIKMRFTGMTKEQLAARMAALLEKAKK